MFELLTFGHLEKIAIGFGISRCKGAEGDRYGGKIPKQMATWPRSVPAVRTLDSASDAEMAGVAAPASEKAKEATNKISWKQDIFAQTLTNDLHHVFVVYIITNMLPFSTCFSTVSPQNFSSQILF